MISAGETSFSSAALKTLSQLLFFNVILAIVFPQSPCFHIKSFKPTHVQYGTRERAHEKADLQSLEKSK
jgi:hypothetical protein